MSKKLSLGEIDKEIQMDRLKKENPTLYKSIKDKEKAFSKGKTIRK